MAVAKDYPETGFLMGSSGGPDGNNFSVFGTWNHEAAYLTGILAGFLTKTNVLGAVGGHPIPEVNRLIHAFRDGVRETKPDAKFLVGFIGTWFDPPKAKESGLAQIDAGADILFGERIGTADAAAERNILAVGSLIDYSERYPGTVFANAMWNFRPIVEAAAADVGANNIVARDYSEFSFMKHGGNDIIFRQDDGAGRRGCFDGVQTCRYPRRPLPGQNRRQRADLSGPGLGIASVRKKGVWILCPARI